MNSKMIKKIPVLTCALLAAQGWAQSNSHAGNSLGFQLSKSKLSHSTLSAESVAPLSTWAELSSIRFDHLQPLDENWLIGFMVDFNLTEQKSSRTSNNGTPVVVSTNEDPAYTYTPSTASSATIKRKASVHAQIGYAFNTSQVLIARLGLHRGNVTQVATGEGTYSEACLAMLEYCQGQVDLMGLNNSAGNSSGKSNLNGHSISLAYRHNLTKNVFINLETQKVFYKNNQLLNTKSNAFDWGIGLGYRF